MSPCAAFSVNYNATKALLLPTGEKFPKSLAGVMVNFGR